MIEYFGQSVNKDQVFESIAKSVGKLNPVECCRVSWVVAPGEVKYRIKESGCVVVATDVGIANGGEVMSYIVASPDFEQRVCYLMGATIEEFRGRHLQSIVTTDLITNCEKCPNCPIEMLVGETRSEKIKSIGRKLGFEEKGNEFVWVRKGVSKTP